MIDFLTRDTTPVPWLARLAGTLRFQASPQYWVRLPGSGRSALQPSAEARNLATVTMTGLFLLGGMGVVINGGLTLNCPKPTLHRSRRKG